MSISSSLKRLNNERDLDPRCDEGRVLGARSLRTPLVPQLHRVRLERTLKLHHGGTRHSALERTHLLVVLLRRSALFRLGVARMRASLASASGRAAAGGGGGAGTTAVVSITTPSRCSRCSRRAKRESLHFRKEELRIDALTPTITDVESSPRAPARTFGCSCSWHRVCCVLTLSIPFFFSAVVSSI